MYNYYTYNKEQLANQKELKRKEKEASSKTKYKLQQEKMINNHQTRVKRFVLELVKNPLIIQDVTIHDNYLYKSLNGNKTAKSSLKAFEFGQFLTDRERIKRLLDSQKEESKKVIHQKTKSKSNTTKYEQPKMRFKHRTQLERIVDQLNHYNYNEKNNEILKRQIKKLKLDAVKKPKKVRKKINYSFDTISTNNEVSTEDNCVNGKIGQYKNQLIQEKEKLTGNFLKRKEANMSMRELMKEYNVHTYFKTAKQLVDFKEMKQNQQLTPQIISPINRRYSYGKNPKQRITLIKHSTRNSVNYIKDNSNDNLSTKKRIENELSKQLSINKTFISNLISKYSSENVNNLDFVNDNPLLYKITKDKQNLSATERFSSKSQQYLFQISRKTSLVPTPKGKYFVSFADSGEDVSLKGKNSFEQMQDLGFGEHDKVLIDNEIFTVNQIDLITKKMLKKCNFIRSKSTSNNTRLKKGNGKLMMTSGLTVKEFSQKFHV